MATAFDTLPHDHPQPAHLPPAGRALAGHQHRRAMLRTMAAAGAVAAVPVTAEAGIVDPHVAWRDEWRARMAAWPKGKDYETGDPDAEHLWELERLIVDTPAQTLAGVLVRTELAMIYVGAEDPRGPDEGLLEYRIMRNIREDLLRIAGRAAS